MLCNAVVVLQCDLACRVVCNMPYTMTDEENLLKLTVSSSLQPSYARTRMSKLFTQLGVAPFHEINTISL